MKETKKNKGIPASEKEWTIYKTRDGISYVTTSKPDRSIYYLYRIDGEIATKLGKGANPKVLEETYIEEIRNK